MTTWANGVTAPATAWDAETAPPASAWDACASPPSTEWINCAAPTLIAISPDEITQGTVEAVTLTGTHFKTGATVQISGTGVVASNVVVVNATTITCDLTAALSATVSERTVTVTTDLGTTNAVPLDVLEDPAFLVTGGTAVVDGLYTVRTFLASEDFVVSQGTRQIRRLIVGGGGPGGSINGTGVGTGGGGAGGVRDIDDLTPVGPGTYPVVVGDGGTASAVTNGTDGDPSSFMGDTVLGGGRGGGIGDASGNPGGSGGGGSAINSGGNPGSAGTPGQGTDGATGRPGQLAGGGGGAGVAPTLSDGGAGLLSDITGTPTYYGGGGGGMGGVGGVGGGGNSQAGVGFAGTPNTGGGGGGTGGGVTSGGAGGKGVVILRYLT